MMIHDPALFLRISINVATITTAIAVIAAGIAVGVIAAKLAAQSGKTDPFFETTVVLQSSSSLVFNRIIQPYEFDSYYNTTQTLIDLTGELNEYLSGKFPTTFIKAYTYGISLYPQKTITQIRRRRQNCMCTIGIFSRPGCPRCGTTPIPSHTNQGTYSTTSMTSTTSNFANIASTMRYSTFDTMTPSSEDISHCNISIYYDGTVQPALIYLNGTLYFNSTQQNKPDPTVIKDALQSFDPVVILIDKCLHASPAASTFNFPLSAIQPLSVVDGNATILYSNDTYSLPLISLTNSVTPPSVTPQLPTTTIITSTIVTITTTVSG
ncbi:unnamed protein product [Adineta steineri]|uniref:Uncharacterized protein n=2 Tax=Adineta steineri TaxID=433720 RepID=A0A819LDZ6_9BILA|nr:unnamed protein product [Adineta steineri]